MDLTYLSFLIGLLGAVGTLYFGIKSKKLEKEIRTFGWHDIEHGVTYLSKIYRKEQPDIIFSISGQGSIIANLMMIETSIYKPLFVGLSEKKNNYSFFTKPYKKYIETSTWKTYIPDILFSYVNKKILICDDSTISGDTLERLIILLVNNGFKRENITTMTIFSTDVAVSSNKAPDYYWYEINTTNYYLPWGHSINKNL